MKTTSDLKEKILELKKRKNAVILAHYYQEEAIQEIEWLFCFYSSNLIIKFE